MPAACPAWPLAATAHLDEAVHAAQRALGDDVARTAAARGARLDIGGATSRAREALHQSRPR